jgi:hypothetical protein
MFRQEDPTPVQYHFITQLHSNPVVISSGVTNQSNTNSSVNSVSNPSVTADLPRISISPFLQTGEPKSLTEFGWATHGHQENVTDRHDSLGTRATQNFPEVIFPSPYARTHTSMEKPCGMLDTWEVEAFQADQFEVQFFY